MPLFNYLKIPVPFIEMPVRNASFAKNRILNAENFN